MLLRWLPMEPVERRRVIRQRRKGGQASSRVPPSDGIEASRSRQARAWVRPLSSTHRRLATAARSAALRAHIVL